MKNRIKELLEEVKDLQAITKDELESMRIKYLSKKGEISALFNDFKTISNEQKKEVGQMLNELKNAAQEKINEINNRALDLLKRPNSI